MQESAGLEPGGVGVDFELPNANPEVGGAVVALSDIITAEGAIIVFECNHCPYVVGSIGRINNIAMRAVASGLGFAGINSNDAVMYPDDSFSAMRKRAKKGMPYAYLHDESQRVARTWGAERTPEFYLLNGDGIIVYRGRLDDSPSDPMQATTNELSDALGSLLAGAEPAIPRTTSIGCSVKWKA